MGMDMGMDMGMGHGHEAWAWAWAWGMGMGHGHGHGAWAWYTPQADDELLGHEWERGDALVFLSHKCRPQAARAF